MNHVIASLRMHLDAMKSILMLLLEAYSRGDWEAAVLLLASHGLASKCVFDDLGLCNNYTAII